MEFPPAPAADRTLCDGARNFLNGVLIALIRQREC